MTTLNKVLEVLDAIPHMFVTDAEKNFDPAVTVEFTANHWNIAIIAVVVYLSMVAFGPGIMASRKAYDLKYPLAAWNALLCVFSAIGMFRTAPYLISLLLSKTFEETICTSKELTWAYGPVGAWVMLMNFSKLFELIDTAFIVLRKKPLMFLHWYHHTTVLLFCWNAYSTSSGSGIYFVAMNYTIHAIMYGYYCLTALNLKPKWFPPVVITLAQTAQMFVGTFVCGAGWYYRNLGRPCANDYSNLVWGAIMYSTYLYLFSDFAVRKYLAPKAPRKAKAVAHDAALGKEQ